MRKPRVRRMRLETTSGRRKIWFTRHGIRRKWRPIQTWGPRSHYFPAESTERQVRKCVHRDLPGVSQFASLLESSRRHNGYSSNVWRVISLHVAQIRRPGDTGDKWEALHVTAHLAADSCFLFFFPAWLRGRDMNWQHCRSSKSSPIIQLACFVVVFLYS